jgi:glyoxylase-like metal-dependent hydrolase (beta-lactamase superfamily II)
MINAYTAAPDIDVLTSNFPIPGLGLVPVNAFVIKGSEPLLVDTGVAIERGDFMAALERVIDPADLRWIWLTHTDFDHIGTLHELLGNNPRLRVITTFLGAGIMSLSAPLPLDRVYFVNPGETVTLGNRVLTAFKPPVFDNPSTTGFYDKSSGALFSSDCFGALLQSVPTHAADIADSDLRDGQVCWATIDSPWLHKVDRAAFAADLEAVRRIDPTLVLSSHLPTASGHMLERMLKSLALAPDAQAFAGPNQAAFESMLKQMTGVVA